MTEPKTQKPDFDSLKQRIDKMEAEVKRSVELTKKLQTAIDALMRKK